MVRQNAIAVAAPRWRDWRGVCQPRHSRVGDDTRRMPKPHLSLCFSIAWIVVCRLHLFSVRGQDDAADE